MERRIQKEFLVFERIGSELVALNGLYYEEITFPPQSVC